MEHEGYFGALGAFLASWADDRNRAAVEHAGVAALAHSTARKSSLSAPEEGDDAFNFASPGATHSGSPMLTGEKSLLDIMAELRLT